METVPATRGRSQAALGDSRLKRVFAIWSLLFFNTLTPTQGAILPIPHRVAQLLTQAALALALVLALTINPRLRIRPNWFLGLYTLLAVTSLMMSVRLVGLGTAYRSVRLIAFLAVLWLLTPWWGRRDLTVLRCQMRFLLIILATVVLGLFISPGTALPAGRLSGAIWPIWSTQVAHYAAEVAGLTVVLWLSRLLSGRRAVMLAVPAILLLVLTHTRTALMAMVIALLVAGVSLFSARRRVRRAFTVGLIVLVVAGVPAAPYLTHWLAAGRTASSSRTSPVAPRRGRRHSPCSDRPPT